jgi:hypothetical protein
LLKSIKIDQNSLYYNIIHSLRSKVSFSEEEIKKYELTLIEKEDQTSNYQWNQKGFEEIEVEFSELELEIITKPLTKMEESGKITDQFKLIHAKFVIGPDLIDRIEEPEELTEG